MNKKFNKPLEQTDKKCEDKQFRDKEEYNRMIKERLIKLNTTRLNILSRGQKVLLDRGDSKSSRNEDFHLKYDGTKSNRSVEVGIKPVKIITNSVNGINRNGASARKSNEIYKAISNNKKLSVEDAKPKPPINCKQTDRKMAEETRTLDKESHPQKICEKNVTDPTANEYIKNGDQKRNKIKEVITIPYLPAEDSATQMTDDDLSEQTKPILKTDTSKTRNGIARVAKTVSFKDQCGKTNGTGNKLARIKPSLASFKGKALCSRTRLPNGKVFARRKKKNCSPSPDKYNINDFPPTEVVKWEPSCLTSETKPYYEAWIDTTLTAFSKCSDEEKLLLEKELIEAFRYLKRPASPELMYERYNDEKYTGRIKIRRQRR